MQVWLLQVTVDLLSFKLLQNLRFLIFELAVIKILLKCIWFERWHQLFGKHIFKTYPGNPRMRPDLCDSSHTP